VNSDGTLCRIADIPDGGGKGFVLEGEERFAIFVLRRGDRVLAYRNRCPHRGTPLDWLPDRFIDTSGEHILCATHGALFRFEDGVCVAGPCRGARLEPVEIRRDGERLALSR
jgi:nitrite reductase/ring-hydroxylating ferredoxin subunit